jgi:hypothetical protein
MKRRKLITASEQLRSNRRQENSEVGHGNSVAALLSSAKKREQINITIKQLNWLLGRKSNLAIENKFLIYKTIIIPIWTYGLELWGCSSKSSISIIQRSQSKILRMIVDAPWYVSNATLNADLGISNVHEVIHQKSNKHHTRLGTHENPLLKKLLLREENRRLKRNWPIDLI